MGRWPGMGGQMQSARGYTALEQEVRAAQRGICADLEPPPPREWPLAARLKQ